MLGLGLRAGAQKRVFPLASYSWTPGSTAFFSSFPRPPVRSRLPLALGHPRVAWSSVRDKSIFQHRWFHPEPKPGEPPRQSFRVFWTVSAFLLGFSGVYMYYVDPWVEKWRASPIAGFTKPRGEPVFDKDNFFPYVVKHIKDYNHNTKLLTFYTPNGEAPNLPVASALLIQTADEKGPKDEKGNPVIRPYTPVSDLSFPGEFTLLIKKYDTGKLTPHIFSLKKGDKLAMKGPIRKFDYKIDEFSHVGLIGGGSGITPLYQVLTYALRDPNNTTKFTLLFGNVSEKDILLKEELDRLKKKHPNNFDVVYFVDKSDGSGVATEGYITKDAIKKYFDPSLGNKIKVFVCGPPPQIKAISGTKKGYDQGELSGALKELGFTENQVYKF